MIRIGRQPGRVVAVSARGAMRRFTVARRALVFTTALALTITGAASAAVQGKPGQIRFEYQPPSNSAHQVIHDQMRQGRALEHLQQLLAPFRLPYPLTLKVAGCDGIANAWYKADVITVCYELLADILKNAPAQDLAIGISRADTVIGPVLDTFLHETGHAVFDMLQIPVLGREEDAADFFSAYIMLRLSKDEARRLVLGAAYRYRAYVSEPEVTAPIAWAADEHSLPAQRAFSLLCIAYGSDRELFVDIVEKNFLPRTRAASCETDYEDLSFAMTKLIAPHIDRRIARKSHETWARTVEARRARLNRP